MDPSHTADHGRPPQAQTSSPRPNGSLYLSTADVDSQKQQTSAPSTPNPRNGSRRPSQAAVSPMASATSPRPPSRRPSSSASVRQTSSPNPKLLRKSSRSSLGGTPDEPERRPTPKRSISNLIAGLREAQSTMESIEEPIPLTAAQVATDHFMRELLGHTKPETEAETMVILHDACYGHRFSRLKATKTTLSMIVERPERIHASILGASTAYVRLGGHHAGERHAPHPDRTDLTPPPFKIRRSARSLDIMSSFVTNVHGTGWMSELQGMCNAAPGRLASGAKELERAAGPGSEQKKLHEGDLYLAPESLLAFQGALGGVADAVDAVFGPSRTSRAFVAVRPPGHHCSADYPSGFCWLNNVHVGIEYAAQTHGLTHAAILDFDLHHGDGSQAITWERNSKNNVKRLNAKPTTKLKLGPDIGYYSLHDINSYPCEMGDDEKVQAASLCIDNAHGQSVWNVHLQPWKTVEDFWRLYEEQYRVLIDKARLFLRHQAARIKEENKVAPKAAIFLSAGFDASEWESAGMQRHKVNVPTEFYARFTRDVVALSQEAGSACEGRVISVLEGGYSDRALCSGVLSHLSGLCTAPVTTKTNGAADIMGLSSRLGGMSLSGLDATSNEAATYNTDWWSAPNLTALENQVNPPPPPQAKKVRTGPHPTYATPTESFAYKVVDANKFARSVSGTLREGPVPVRPPTPPPPEVDWVVATQELSKLLIPTDRQTKSCTPEELAAPRVKKERESIAPVEAGANPRQLRDRRGKAPVPTGSVHSDETDTVRSVSRSSRRETIDVLPSDSSVSSGPTRASRRLSAGSALGSVADLDRDPPPVPAVPKSASTMKPPPVPSAGLDIKKSRLPPKTKTPDGTAPGHPAPVVPKSATPGTQAPAAALRPFKPATQDVDSLTTGMKKITLKVSSTKEEHDRRQKEKLDAERRARALKGAETRRINAAAKKAAGESSAPTAKTAKTGVPVAVKKESVAVPPPAAVPSIPIPAPVPVEQPVMNLSSINSIPQPHPPAPAPSAPQIAQPMPLAQKPLTPQVAQPYQLKQEPPAPQVWSPVPQSSVPNYAQAPPQMHYPPMGQPPVDPIPQQIPYSQQTSQVPFMAAPAGSGPYGYPPVPQSHTVFDAPAPSMSHAPPALSPALISSARSSGLPVWTSTGPIPFGKPADGPRMTPNGQHVQPEFVVDPALVNPPAGDVFSPHQ